jgi:hypothetical protein
VEGICLFLWSFHLLHVQKVCRSGLELQYGGHLMGRRKKPSERRMVERRFILSVRECMIYPLQIQDVTTYLLDSPHLEQDDDETSWMLGNQVMSKSRRPHPRYFSDRWFFRHCMVWPAVLGNLSCSAGRRVNSRSWDPRRLGEIF